MSAPTRLPRTSAVGIVTHPAIVIRGHDGAPDVVTFAMDCGERGVDRRGRESQVRVSVRSYRPEHIALVKALLPKAVVRAEGLASATVYTERRRFGADVEERNPRVWASPVVVIDQGDEDGVIEILEGVE